jgi:hypothetical protein
MNSPDDGDDWFLALGPLRIYEDLDRLDKRVVAVDAASESLTRGRRADNISALERGAPTSAEYAPSAM